MSLKKLLVLLSLVSCFTTAFTAPARAATDGVEIDACSVFSEADSTDGKGAEEEEPDCE